MTFTHALRALFTDDKFTIALLLITVDFVLGVLAAFNKRTFRLSYVADFARNDVAQKLAPWATLYIASKFAPQEGLGGLDLGLAAGALYVVIVAAWTGSIIASLTEIGLPIRSRTIAGSENGGRG
jgi:hypothetical protein